jgi:hypothetical protein
MDRLPYGEARFYQGELFRHQSHHGDFACSCDGVAMLDGDGTYFSTHVPTV